MIYDLQKASFLKRLSAFILDAILLLVLVTGLMLLLAPVLNIEGHYADLEKAYQKYEQKYQTSFRLTQEEYEALSEADRAVLDAAYEEFSKDEDALYAYNMLINLLLLMIPLSIFTAYLLLEFAVPMLFGNGQTVGKKVFAIGVMRVDGVKLNGVTLFVRSILGKYTVETMVPVMLIIMVLVDALGIVGPAVILLMGILQVILLIVTQTNSAIHDCLAHTVTVDLQSQMIFGSESELIDYKKRLHEEKVNKSTY